MSAPLVSICLPTLNARRFLEERIESILAQTLGDWELVICDSGSVDGTWEYLREFESDARIRLFRVPAQGMYAGWNACLERAEGTYVYVATADDTCSEDLLEQTTGALDRHPDIDLAVCDFDFIDDNGKVIHPPPRGTARTFYGDWLGRPHRRSGQLELVVHSCIDISWTTMTAVVFRRSLLGKTGLFRTDCNPIADKFWAIKTAVHSDTVFVPGKLATWRWHLGQRSSDLDVSSARLQCRLTAETLDECESLVPAAWREEPGWRKKLLWGARRNCLEGYRLDRASLRRRPAGFFAGLCGAAIHEPRYLARRLASGLSWDDRDLADEHGYAKSLVEKWHVPWPPEALDLSMVEEHST